MRDIEKLGGKLEELAARYKNNKKLTRNDKLEAERALELLLLERSQRSKGYIFMLTLPQDTAGSAFLKAWLESEESEREALVAGLVEHRDFTGEVGYNRLIELIRHFIPESGNVAMRLLLALSDKLTDSGSARPPNKYVARFKSVLMDSNDLLKIPAATKHELSSHQKASIAIVVMCGLLFKGNDDGIRDVEWLRLYLQWLEKLGAPFKLPAKVVQELEKETGKWPEELQRQCVQMGLVTVMTTRLYQGPEGAHLPASEKRVVTDRAASLQKEESEQIADVSEETKKAEEQKTQERFERNRVAPVSGERGRGQQQIRDGFDAIRYLEQLGHYIRSLEEKQKKMSEELFDARLVADGERRKRREFEDKLSEAMKCVQESEFRIKKLQSEIAEAQNRIEELNSQLAEERKKHESETAELLEMIEINSRQAVEQMKNRLASKLRTDFMDFRQVDGEQMTVELGENLRVQLRNIFTLLAEEDINL